MSEQTDCSPEQARRRTAATALVGSIVTSAKTAGLYAPGHPAVPMIAERVRELLMRTLGQETTITLSIKAKSVALDEVELDETPETVGFASALHTLGMGQILFTNRMSKESFQQFFPVLTAKPESGKTLTDLQKEVQQLRIDGLQMVFILSFVVTGDAEEKPETPGELSEQQLAAFLGAAALPDFLALWLRHNTEFRGNQARAVTDLLEGLLYREISAEKFEQELPWTIYDRRMRARWDEFRAAMSRSAGDGGRRAHWPRPILQSWASIRFEDEAAALRAHSELSKSAAMRLSLPRARALLDAGGAPSRLKYASLAYARLICEMGRDGDLPTVLEERAFWARLEKDHARAFDPLFALVRSGLTCAEMSAVVAQTAAAPGDAARVDRLVDLAVFLGDTFAAQLLEQLRSAQDKEQRQRLCALLAAVFRAVGDKRLVAALSDPDWFLVSQALGILSELGAEPYVKIVARLLSHAHRKVREAAVKCLGKVGGPEAIGALAAFVAGASVEDEEVGKAVITLSRLQDPEVGRRLIESFRKTKSYASRVAIVRALSRFPGPETLDLLKEAARRSWYEILSGLNKELREAARQSLEAMRKEEKT